MRHIKKLRTKEWKKEWFVQVTFAISVCPKVPFDSQEGAWRNKFLVSAGTLTTWCDISSWGWPMSRRQRELWCWTTYGAWSELWKLLPGVQTFALDKQKCAHEKVPHCNQPPRSVMSVLWCFVKPSHLWKSTKAGGTRIGQSQCPLWCHTGQCYWVLCFCTQFLFFFFVIPGKLIDSLEQGCQTYDPRTELYR